MATWCIVIVLVLKIIAIYCLKIKNLGGKWTVEESTGKFKNLSATVPGGIYSDLMDNKIIGDVFYGYNDTETRWVSKTNWTYKKEFFVDNVTLIHKKINIVFEGVDTFATVVVNDIEIGKTQNMFLRYIFDVKNVLKLGSNKIEVKFTSPILMAQVLSTKQGYTVPPECPPEIYNGECHVNQIRKMQSSFSWDWGPALPSMGIWKEVYLEAVNSSVIRYLLVEYEDAPNDSWLIKASTYLSSTKGENITGKIIRTLQTDVSIIQSVTDVNYINSNNSEDIKIDSFFTIPKLIVKRWWPNGYGEQRLYNITVAFQNGLEISTKSIKVGFRQIELVQDSLGTGLSFYFKVNGVPIFAKGSNEIPLDILPEKGQNPEKVSRILYSAYESNMNMLRVWGGGVYESDYFYQKADELGILIWQDFMFACAMYPTYPGFLENVKAEVRHQVKRLHSHPSIAIWAGNNENEIALTGNWYNTKNDEKYKKDYVELYVKTIRSELFNITQNVLFITSSPSNGKESESEDYLSKNPGNPLFGDVHFYNYLLNSLEANVYPIPRFASEFGYQSLPDIDSWLNVTANITDLDPGSDFMAHRQHHPFGLITNNLLIGYQLKLNSSIKDYYKTYIFYSQIVQAMSIKFETEYYRSFMGRINKQGHGNTMGSLYWQLNDVWIAPTWSGIDYTGKWKMLHYFAKEFFAPTIITAYLDVTRQLQIFVISETLSLLDSNLEVTALIQVYNWTSFDPVNTEEFNVSLEFGKSIEVTTIDTDSYLESIGCGSLSDAKINCFLYLTLLLGSSVIAPHNLILTTSLQKSRLEQTTVKISSIKQIDSDGKKFEINVEATGVSLFVWLDSHEIRGRFNENGFAQVIPTKNITFQSEEATSVFMLRKIVTVIHLNNQNYQ